MLDLERTYDPDEVLRLVLDAFQGRIWTAMPGIVDAFNAAENTCRVQVAIKGKLRALDAQGVRSGPYQDVAIPLLVDCPVIFPQGGGFALTFPIAQGDEALVIFASRCIDAWWESGAVSPQAELRMHDLSDGFVLPGVRSKPKALANVSADSVQLRTEDGTVFVEVADAGVFIKGNLEVEGDVLLTGNLAITGAAEAGGTDIGPAHVHSGVAAGGANTGPVVP